MQPLQNPLQNGSLVSSPQSSPPTALMTSLIVLRPGCFFACSQTVPMSALERIAMLAKTPRRGLPSCPVPTCSEVKRSPSSSWGSFAKPGCFKWVSVLPTENKAQHRAWMNGDFFTNWLFKLDNQFTIQKRKIAIVLDNCSAHPHWTQGDQVVFPTPKDHICHWTKGLSNPLKLTTDTSWSRMDSSLQSRRVSPTHGTSLILCRHLRM